MSGRAPLPGGVPESARWARGAALGSEGSVQDTVLVLGIGNLLLGDEGVGLHVVHLLERQPHSPSVRLLDGGTGGLHLLSWICGFSALVVVDATIDGQASGTVTHLAPSHATDYPPTLVAHDIGLKDLIDAAKILGAWPHVALVTVSIDSVPELSLELSDAVAEAVPRAAWAVREALHSLGVPLRGG